VAKFGHLGTKLKNQNRILEEIMSRFKFGVFLLPSMFVFFHFSLLSFNFTVGVAQLSHRLLSYKMHLLPFPGAMTKAMRELSYKCMCDLPCDLTCDLLTVL
jgi:hypothetical protein